MKTLGELRKWREDNRWLGDEVPIELQIGWESSDLWDITFLSSREFIHPKTKEKNTFPEQILIEG